MHESEANCCANAGAKNPLGHAMTLPRAAAYIGISRASLERLVRAGSVPFHRFSQKGRHRFYAAELDRWLESTRGEKAPARAATGGVIDRLMPAVRELS